MPVVLAGAAALLVATASPAQTPIDPTTLIQRCTGPLGTLLPECEAAKNAVEMGPAARSGGNVRPGSNGSPRAGTSQQGIPQQTAAATPVRAEPAPTPAAPVMPQPPTEFQRLVASSLGETLPIFGASLFDGVPTTFAPLDGIPVTADYVLGPGDEILLRTWGQVELDLALTLDRAGAVFIPQVGNVTLAGLQFHQLFGFLRSQLGRVFRNFDMNVNMGQLRSIQVFVVGQARRPGSYTVSSLSTLVNTLFASGGPSAQGSMRRIQLKRGIEVAIEFDLYDLLLKGDKSKDVRLLPGDVIYIPASGPQVAVAGSVKFPAIYEVKGSRTVGEVVQMAGGLSVVADDQRATVERIGQGGAREIHQLRLDKAGLVTSSQDGDLLHINTIQPRFNNAVTLRGNVANPGRFSWRAGLRLRDIIPDKDSLVTRHYWKKRNVLGFTAPDQALPARPDDELRRERDAVTIENSVPEINWSYAVIERQSASDLRTELVPFHLGRLVLKGDDSQNVELHPGDVVTIFSQADFRVPVSQQTRFVRLEGEFNAAGIYPVADGETLGNVIQRAGGLTPQAYLYGAEFQRESVRVNQQKRLDQFAQELARTLEQATRAKVDSAVSQEESAIVAAQIAAQQKVLDRVRAVKASGRIVLNLEPGNNDTAKLMNLPLEDSDRFIVPSRPATVNVLGAVYNPNSFLHEPQMRVAEYLRQAGGPTRNADKRRMFVIRADGTVLPKQASSPFVHKFERTYLYPGDSIVVPEVMFKTPFLRGMRDWTQVLSQLALGAAAINILK